MFEKSAHLGFSGFVVGIIPSMSRLVLRKVQPVNFSINGCSLSSAVHQGFVFLYCFIANQ